MERGYGRPSMRSLCSSLSPLLDHHFAMALLMGTPLVVLFLGLVLVLFPL